MRTPLFVCSRKFTDDLSHKPQVNERARSVTSFYYQSAIDAAAAKVVYRVDDNDVILGVND